MTTEAKRPISLYLSYSKKDEVLKQEFDDYLGMMQQAQVISGWVERQVQPGIDWSQVIDPRLLVADIVLVLLSPSIFASGYCSGAEVRAMFERSKTRQTIVIPIILSPVNLKGYPFEAILSLPRNGRPISFWPERMEAWSDIDWELRKAIEAYQQRKNKSGNT